MLPRAKLFPTLPWLPQARFLHHSDFLVREHTPAHGTTLFSCFGKILTNIPGLGRPGQLPPPPFGIPPPGGPNGVPPGLPIRTSTPSISQFSALCLSLTLSTAPPGGRGLPFPPPFPPAPGGAPGGLPPPPLGHRPPGQGFPPVPPPGGFPPNFQIPPPGAGGFPPVPPPGQPGFSPSPGPGMSGPPAPPGMGSSTLPGPPPGLGEKR